MGVLLLFVDGLGLGEDAPDKNPVARARRQGAWGWSLPEVVRRIGGDS